MKRLFLGFLLSLGMLLPVPAYADHGYEDDCQGGGCGNEREESYEGAGCKYVCPSFDKSPVHDAFNFSPEVCMPGATCYYGDRDKKEEPK